MSTDPIVSPAVMRGEITADPFADAPIGTQVHYKPVEVRHELGLGVGALRDMDVFDGLLLSMHFGKTGHHSVDGSAVLVAPGVALCATHVVAPHVEAMKAGHLGCICIGLSKSGLQIWRLHKGTRVPGTDITILGLTYCAKLPDSNTFCQGSLTTRLPNIGERLTLTGFHSDRFEASDDGGLICHGNVMVCVGEVSARYPDGRDTAMMPWPAIEVDCAALGGMSGGPVFDSAGKLIGLVCSSVSNEAGPGAPAYVSLLWSAMGFPFEGGWPASLFPAPVSLLQLNGGICSIERPGAIVATMMGDVYEWRCNHWSA